MRSRIMRAVRSRDTGPEMLVRALVRRLGYRFRICPPGIPGTPDLAFASHSKAIFVHGCWWHGHCCVRGDRPAQANSDYWARKIERNKQRDQRVLGELRELKWSTLVIWECQLRNLGKVERRVQRFLEED